MEDEIAKIIAILEASSADLRKSGLTEEEGHIKEAYLKVMGCMVNLYILKHINNISLVDG